MANAAVKQKEKNSGLYSSFGSQSIAFGQMQDVIRTQNSLLAKLKYMLDRGNDSVAKEVYDDLRQKLEEEKHLHQITKSELSKRENELQFALKEVELLSKQLEEEKAKFTKAYSNVLSSAQQKSQETNALLDKCTEISEVCGVQGDALKKKEKRIKDLKQRLAEQSQNRRIAENEAELRIQQERYLTGQRDARKVGFGRIKSDWR